MIYLGLNFNTSNMHHSFLFCGQVSIIIHDKFYGPLLHIFDKQIDTNRVHILPQPIHGFMGWGREGGHLILCQRKYILLSKQIPNGDGICLAFRNLKSIYKSEF